MSHTLRVELVSLVYVHACLAWVVRTERTNEPQGGRKGGKSAWRSPPRKEGSWEGGELSEIYVSKGSAVILSVSLRIYHLRRDGLEEGPYALVERGGFATAT